MFERGLSDDRREALGYEPCERCRLRGGRCARCKALRTGGGYIILDAGMEGDWTQGKKRQGYGKFFFALYFPRVHALKLADFRWAGAGQSVVGSGAKRRRHRVEAEMAGDGTGGWLDDGGGELGSGDSSRAGRTWERKEGPRDDRGWGGTEGDSGRRDGLGEGSTRGQSSKVSVHT